MTKQIEINVQRTGFPIKIGNVELWFDSSLENLRRFFNADELAQKKLKEAQERAEHIHFPKEVKEFEDLDIETVDAAFDVSKEYIAARYDILFGDGKFKEIYEVYSDVLALEQALEPIEVAIADRIEEQNEERAKELDSKKEEALKKQKEKQK